jgi:O-antigen ligase
VFWLSLIGVFYSSNFNIAIETVIQNTPFLIVPLIIFTTIKDGNVLIQFMRIFSFSVIIGLLFGISKAFYFKINNLGDFFYYREFSRILEIHTTYFALFIIISIVFFLLDVFKLKSLKLWVNILSIIFLLTALYIISSRISMIALLIVGILFLISDLTSHISNKKKSLILLIFVAISIAFLASPNFQNRSSGVSEFGYQTPSLDSRLVHWKAVLNTVKSNNILIGNGSGDGHDGLFEEYLKIGFESGYRLEYNAHNQFLEYILYFGIIGFLSLVSVFVFCFFKSIKLKDGVVLIITSTFFIFMLIESMLERHSGIVFFVFLMSLCCVRIKYRFNNHRDYEINT